MATKKTAATLGETMMNILKKAGEGAYLTTEQLAEDAGVTVKDAYSRLYWLAKREGLLKSKGHGKTRQWAFTVRGVKSMAPPAEA